jgi:8-oxo-dGTP diphosphatase
MRSRPARLPNFSKPISGEGIQRIASYALITQDEALLLCRLSGKVKPAGQWTLPGGGVEFGEHPEEAVVREVLEETGFEVALDGIAGVDSMLYRYPGPPRHAIRLLFRAHITGGQLKHEADGTTDRCAWVTRERAKELPLVDLAELGMRLALETESG